MNKKKLRPLTREERLAVRRASEDALEEEKRKLEAEAEGSRIGRDRNYYQKEMKP